jgi:hypothetical protein
LPTITETLANPATLSLVLELATLFFIILGFFRWYDRKYATVIDKTTAGLTEKINDLKKTVEGLANDYHDYVTDRALQKDGQSTKRGRSK